LNWVDFLILAILAWFTYSAFHAGMIREIVAIIGAVFAVALAGLFYRDLATDVQVAVDNQQTAEIVAFAMIFGAVVLASQLIASFMKSAASVLMLGFIDSLGGALIGMLKGAVFIEIALIIAVTFTSLSLVNDVDGSVIAPFFLDLIPFLEYILPDEFKSAIEAFTGTD
jgi:membrane protein required for colicin V production